MGQCNALQTAGWEPGRLAIPAARLGTEAAGTTKLPGRPLFRQVPVEGRAVRRILATVA
jgi:hypothetical protein